MPDLETVARDALARRLQLARVPLVPTWDDDMVSAILLAANGTAAPAASHPAADGSEARDIRHGDLLDALLANAGAERDRDASLEDIAVGYVRTLEARAGIAAEMLATFTKNPNGWNARVKQERIDGWRERLGEPG